jgi:hypothetical protein
LAWAALAASVVFVGVVAGLAGEADGVLPLVEPEGGSAEVEALRGRVYLAAQKQARYLLTTVRPWERDPGMKLLTASGRGEHQVRPNTTAIAGFAFLVRFGPYDGQVVGVSREELLEETIVPMMRYVVSTHRTGTRTTADGEPWGDAWQSAHWTVMLGRAGWWLWDDLPADLRAGVRRVVAHEADRIARSRPPHRIRHDTKSEENAWNAQVLSAAVLLMPDDARREGWEAAFWRWVLSSYLRPADEASDAVVDGRRVADHFTGANVYDDFTLENHGFIHPDYMTCFSLSLGCGIDFRLSGREPPEVLLYNVRPVYENLKWFTLPDGGFVYPNGQDWRLFRNPDWTYPHVLMATLGGDPEALALARRCLDTLERMQARSPSGQVYLDEEYFFASTQQGVLYGLSLGWLALGVDEPPGERPCRRLGVRRLDHGKVVLHRTPAAVHTLAWGARAMAQCVPLGRDRIVSPHVRNGIGWVRLAGGREPLPIQLREADVQSRDDGFTAGLVVDHGEAVRAELRFVSHPDGRFTIHEKLTVLADVTTAEVATGLVGILNNPRWVYERGQRRIEMDGRETVVPALSGKLIEQEGVRRISIDGALAIQSDGPLEVRYAAATRPNRARVTDLLSLNQLGGERKWKVGDVISEFEATVACAEPRAETEDGP